MAAKVSEGSQEYLPGVLTITERANGVFIEWNHCDDPDLSWVMTSDDGKGEMVHSRSPGEKRNHGSKTDFSLDVNDLSSFRNDEPKKSGFQKLQQVVKFVKMLIPIYIYIFSMYTINFKVLDSLRFVSFVGMEAAMFLYTSRIRRRYPSSMLSRGLNMNNSRSHHFPPDI